MVLTEQEIKDAGIVNESRRSKIWKDVLKEAQDQLKHVEESYFKIKEMNEAIITLAATKIKEEAEKGV